MLREINFPRCPKLVKIQQTDEKTIRLDGYHGPKHRTTAHLDVSNEPSPEYTREVVEEFRQSIDAPLKGKKKQ